MALSIQGSTGGICVVSAKMLLDSTHHLCTGKVRHEHQTVRVVFGGQKLDSSLQDRVGGKASMRGTLKLVKITPIGITIRLYIVRQTG